MLLRASRKVLRTTGHLLIRASERIPMPVLSPDRLAPADRQVLLRNAQFQNQHRGRRCFVVGNGPSLQEQDLTPLAGEITFVVNAFWNHPILKVWQPTYYCLVDPAFFDGSPVMETFFRSLRAKVTGPTTFFAPLHSFETLLTRRLVEEQRWLPPERTFYVALDDSLAARRLLDVDPTGLLPSVLNVAQLAIMLALFMGCSPIVLMGLDHDWLAHPGPDRHFYPGGSGLEEHPGLELEGSRRSYRSRLELFLKLWRGYETLAELAERRGARILNATNGGFLDVYERIPYNEALST